jgi:DNA-directed RNA polymerase specialized sigma24 family protein
LIFPFLKARFRSCATRGAQTSSTVQRSGAELDRVGNLRAGIFRSTRNVLIDHHRAQARRESEALLFLYLLPPIRRAPGLKLEDYVVSAVIQAIKP